MILWQRNSGDATCVPTGGFGASSGKQSEEWHWWNWVGSKWCAYTGRGWVNTKMTTFASSGRLVEHLSDPLEWDKDMHKTRWYWSFMILCFFSHILEANQGLRNLQQIASWFGASWKLWLSLHSYKFPGMKSVDAVVVCEQIIICSL